MGKTTKYTNKEHFKLNLGRGSSEQRIFRCSSKRNRIRHLSVGVDETVHYMLLVSRHEREKGCDTGASKE